MSPLGALRARVLTRHLRVSYRVLGAENLPDAETPCVVLAKHQSAWDPFWLGAELPGGACFLYKRSLHWIPVIGWLLMSMHMVPIDRAKGRSAFQGFMTIGRERLREGWWICLFPEGTRVAPGQRIPLKTGGARFACATGVPVVPVMHDAGRCWPKNSISKHPGVITVVVGEPIDTTGLEPHDVTQRVQEWYVAVEKELGGS